MRAQECILTQPLNFEEIQAMFTSAVTGVVNLFGDGCCIDTQPPFPLEASRESQIGSR